MRHHFPLAVLLVAAGTALATKPMPEVHVELVVAGEVQRVDGAQAGWGALHATNRVLEVADQVRSLPGDRWGDVLQGRCVVLRFGDSTDYRYGHKRVVELRIPLPVPGFLASGGEHVGDAFAEFEVRGPDGDPSRWHSWLTGVPPEVIEDLARAMATPSE